MIWMSRFRLPRVPRINHRAGGPLNAAAWIAIALALLPAHAFGQTAKSEGWSGNFAKNPGFEEDFVNAHGEGHVLSFKGDWFYNQKDLVPDYWNFAGTWTWGTDKPKSGGHYLKLAAGASANQSYPGVAYQEGGSSWAGAGVVPIQVADPAKLAMPWRASVWVRGSGSITLGGATAKAEPEVGLAAACRAAGRQSETRQRDQSSRSRDRGTLTTWWSRKSCPPLPT